MPRARLKFSKLRQILLELGFRQVEISDKAIGFEHEQSDTLLVLPIYNPNQFVMPHHLLYIRIQLDGRGVMDAEDFDELVASKSVQKSAS